MPERGRGVVPVLLSRCQRARSRQLGHGVCPGFDGREDCVRFVGGDADFVAGERHVVYLAGGVVALDGGGIPLGVGVVHRVAAHGGSHVLVGEDRGLHGGDGCDGRCTDGHVSDGLRFQVFVEDLGGVAFTAGGHGGLRAARGLVCGASEGVGAQDALDD